jgi:hypothetical protein
VENNPYFSTGIGTSKQKKGLKKLHHDSFHSQKKLSYLSFSMLCSNTVFSVTLTTNYACSMHYLCPTRVTLTSKKDTNHYSLPLTRLKIQQR